MTIRFSLAAAALLGSVLFWTTVEARANGNGYEFRSPATDYVGYLSSASYVPSNPVHLPPLSRQQTDRLGLDQLSRLPKSQLNNLAPERAASLERYRNAISDARKYENEARLAQRKVGSMNRMLDRTQMTLGVAGMTPGVGALADMTNAGLSLARGNRAGAALDGMAALPIVGGVSGARRVAKSANQIMHESEGRYAGRANMDRKPLDVFMRRSKHPGTAAHVDQAQRLGQPSVLTIDRNRGRVVERRRDAMRYIPRRGEPVTIGKDRDEYPPAMTREGGINSDVRYVRSGDNRGAGKSFERQTRHLRNGDRVRVIVVD
jgi:hypothetical protein